MTQILSNLTVIEQSLFCDRTSEYDHFTQNIGIAHPQLFKVLCKLINTPTSTDTVQYNPRAQSRSNSYLFTKVVISEYFRSPLP